jgi:hypothetical protein
VLEAEPPVEVLGARVVRPHLQEHLGAVAAPGLVQQVGQQRRPDALTPVPLIDGDRQHLGLAATGEHHPGVSHERVSFLGRDVVAAASGHGEFFREHAR